MERKLVTIQRIESLAPIEGADNIVKARVMGWDVVVKKNEFAVGDPCVFFEIDSVLPDGPAWAEFMRARGFRVKTVKLRGVLSQGLALPVDILGDDLAAIEAEGFPVNAEVTSLLGVTKYEPPVPGENGPNRVTVHAGEPFPTRVPKTDETRLQSALACLRELAGKDFYVTTKLDGMSATYFRDFDGQLIVCSRNWVVKAAPGDVYHAMAERYRLHEIPIGIAVQGEICGPKIQKNRLGLREPDLFVFTVFDANGNEHRANGNGYYSYSEWCDFCTRYKLKMVPVEDVVVGHRAATYGHSLDGWLEVAKGSYEGTKNRKEGIVIRPLVETYSRKLQGRLSFKVINNEFLLKDEG
jgi:RNA ligase (TIGR02306 family)